MLKSCQYCGRIHKQGEECKLKPKPKRKYYKKKLTEENKEIQRFRWSKQWQHKREYIKKRDNYMCVACLLGLRNTAKRLILLGCLYIISYRLLLILISDLMMII